MRLGISTTHQPVSVLKDLLEREAVEFIELGTGLSKKAEETIKILGRSSIETLHGLPFMDESMSDFMFNPCYRPLEAAGIFEKMMLKASQLELEYRFYGVHAGLLGEIVGPNEFTLKDRIDKKKGIENLLKFRTMIQRSSKVIIENIYGWNSSAIAIGMTQEEIEEMGKCFPLLLDIAHAAINFEVYRGGSIDDLKIEGLPIKEVHVSFMKKYGPPPWDHRGFVETQENLRIMSKLREIVNLFPDIPVVLEIEDEEKNVEKTVNMVTQIDRR